MHIYGYMVVEDRRICICIHGHMVKHRRIYLLGHMVVYDTITAGYA